MLQSDSENTTSVKVGEQSIGGLAMNGGTLIFDTDIPAATLAEGYISVDTLVVGAGDYTWKGRNYQVNGTGDVLIDVPISATLPQPTRCLAIVYTTVWVSRSIQIHCILRGRQAVCGCVMSEGTNVQGPVTVS